MFDMLWTMSAFAQPEIRVSTTAPYAQYWCELACKMAVAVVPYH
jgi:hypothetical protein